MTHDPRDVETVARLLCEATGYSFDNWQENVGVTASRWLDALRAKGWKVVGENGKAFWSDEKPGDVFAGLPIVPRSEA